jgi:3-hydroxyisobutyrate dehydrogenase-like beta-hydroxyacid dehydrogenase
MSPVAVVGLGAMGSRIAGRLRESGHDVVVWNRTAAKATPLLERGASAGASPADAARHAEVVITMVADAPALAAVSEGADGIAAGAMPGATLIEMSTVGPVAVDRLREVLPPTVGLIDAPVLGSVTEAESGSLTIFAGGAPSLVERFTPLLSTLGSVLHIGPLGSGAAAKLVANATLFGCLALLGEVISLARGLGLSTDATFEVLARTPLSAQAERRRPVIEDGRYPPRFPLALARKDADLIAEAATNAAVETRLIAAARARIADAIDAGLGDRDYTVILARILRSEQHGGF